MNPDYDVLVIDDEPVVVSAARKLLSPEGLSIDDAADTEAALRKLRESRYKTILCDLKLPGAGGWELMRFARDNIPDTPVVMITGYATLANTVESFKIGVYDFLPKPFDVDELIGVIRRALHYADLDASIKRAVGLDEFRNRDHPPGTEILTLHSLGRQTWAARQPDGTATVGIGENFAGLGETIRAVDLPPIGGETLQGKRCGEIAASDDAVCRIVAPLSGSVVETNRDLDFESRCDAESMHRWWLFRLVPNELESELENLTPR